MLDSIGRKIDCLRISITDRCNLRCIYCMPDSGIVLKPYKEILRFEEIKEIVKVFISLGINKIKITGGEPFIRKGIIEFIKSITALKGLADVSITTNGIMLKEYAARLKNAGIKRINVSLDTLDEKKFKNITRSRDSLSSVFDGLYEAGKLGFSPIRINTVVIRGINDDEIMDFVRMSIKHSFEVRFIEYMATNNSIGWSKDKFVSNDEIKVKLSSIGTLYPVENNTGSGPAEYFKVRIPGKTGYDGIGKIGFISPVSSSFCRRCNRLRLTADGKLKLCLHSSNDIDLKTSLREKASFNELKNIIISGVKSKPESGFPNSCNSGNIMSQIGG